MQNTTSYQPVKTQFSLKALIANKIKAKNLRPAVNQLPTSSDKSIDPVKRVGNPVEPVGKQAEPSIEINQSEMSKVADSLPPMREVDGYLVPDYGAWCSGWWRDCLTCPEYSGQAPYFCRKWNRTFCGVDDVREEYQTGKELTRGLKRA